MVWNDGFKIQSFFLSDQNGKIMKFVKVILVLAILAEPNEEGNSWQPVA